MTPVVKRTLFEEDFAERALYLKRNTPGPPERPNALARHGWAGVTMR